MDQLPTVTEGGSRQSSQGLSRRQSKAGDSTPWYSIPGRGMVSVEHPCIIKNIDKGLRTMGEDEDIENLVESVNQQNLLNLYLRPDDVTSKPIQSRNITTNNLLVKVTVPKRTGRKRKRGSVEPYMDERGVPRPNLSSEDGSPAKSNNTATNIDSVSAKAAHLLQSLRDNVDNYKVEPVGVIEQTHRFRGMPDFQYSSIYGSFMNKMRNHILSYDYPSMKKFKLDPSKGTKLNDEIIPPPALSRMYTPINYGYHQNPAVKTAVGSAGHLVTGNTQSPLIIYTQLLPWNTTTIPSIPDPSLTPFEKLDHSLQIVVEHLRGLLAERPIWTRRAFANVLADQKFGNLVRQGFQYVGYMFRSGPWNNSIIKFGVDPRTDPRYRFYQTLMFQLKKEESKIAHKGWEDQRTKYSRSLRGKKRDKRSHLFDGRDVVLEDGKTWQVCDITDPLLKQLLNTDNIRTKCDIEGDGWYHNGTWAKAKTIMKAKILLIREGNTPSDAEFISIMKLPDIIDDVSRAEAILNKKDVSKQEVRWASGVRTLMKKPAPRTESDLKGTVDDGPGLDGNEMNEDEDVAQKEATPEAPVDARVVEAMLELENIAQAGDANQDSKQDSSSLRGFPDSDQEDNDDEDPSEEDEDETGDRTGDENSIEDTEDDEGGVDDESEGDKEDGLEDDDEVEISD